MAIPGAAGGFALAEAFVEIHPKVDGYRREADAQLKREMAGDFVTVPVHAEVDTTDLRRSLSAVSVTEAITAPDPAKIKTTVGILKQELRAQGVTDIADTMADPGRIAAAMQRLKLLLQRVPGGSLPGLADIMDINIPVGVLAQQAERLKVILSKAGGGKALADMLDVNLNTAQVQSGVREIQKAFATLAPGETIPLGLSDPGVLASINDVKQAVESLSALPPAGALDAQGLAAAWEQSVQAIQSRLDGLKVTPEFDQTALARTVNLIQGELDTLQIRALRVGVDKPEVDASVAYIQQKLDGIKLPASLSDVSLPAWAKEGNLPGTVRVSATGVDFTQVNQQLIAMRNATEAAAAPLETLVAELPPAAAGFESTGAAAKGAAAVLEEWLAENDKATTGLEDLDAELEKKPGDMDKTTAAGKRMGIGFLGWGGILTGTIGHVALWHVALDLLVEGLLAVTLAAAAAATGMAALAPTAIDIYNHINAVNQVNSALGDQIPVLGAGFRNMAESAQTASQGVEIYGAAVNIAGNKTGILTQVARQVVTLFDDWAAKIALWSNAQGGFAKLMQDAVGYLQQLGQLVGTLGQALGNLLSRDPGIAHFLLDFINGLAKLFELFTSLPAPIVTTALALHAVYVYGNVAVGLIGKLVTGFSNMLGGVTALSKAGETLSKGFSLGFIFTPVGAAATVAAAGIGFLVYEMLQVPPAAQKAISAINSALQLNPADFLAQFGEVSTQALQQLSVAVHSQQRDWVPYESAIHSSLVNAGKSVQDFAKLDVVAGFNDSGNALTELGKAFVDFWTGSVHGQQEQNAIDGLNAGLKSLVGALGNVFQETGVLLRQGFSVSQSFALMGLAGVQAGDSFALMNQKVLDLLAGYKAMSIQGPILAASVDAVTFATEQQSSKVAQLNSGWDAFFSTVSGGISDLYTFETSLKTLDTQAGVSTKSLGLLSTNSITTGQDFLQAATNANQMADQITTMVSAAGLGAHGTDLITASVKDYVALLLPAARGSQGLTDILYSMAQRGGYQGANSFQALNQWVATASGSVKAMGAAGGPAQQLQGTMTTLTGDVGNLTTDVQNLATALHQTLTGAMAAAVLAADGGQKAFDAFATAIFTTGDNSTADIQAGTKLVDSLIKQTGSVSAAHDAFILFAQQALHLTSTEANTLWTEIDAQLIPAIAKTGTTAVLSSQQISDTFLATLTGIHNLSPQLDSDVNSFTTAVQKTGDTSTRTQGARAQLIKDLENAGYSAQVSAGLVDGLQAQINNLHGKNVNFVMTGQGAGQLYFNATTGVGGSISGGLKFMAGGGSVHGPGGPTSDVIPIMASAGEYVINANSAKKIGVSGLNALNKYAGGGLVGGNFAAFEAGAGAGLNAASNFIAGNELAWGEDVAANWAGKVIAAVKAKLASAAAKVAAGTPVAWSRNAGVTQWENVALQALSLLGLPAGDLPTVMAQILTESGGNPNAINLTDINAQQGDPSRGLLQVIGTTFAAYRNPGLSSNIYDPLANIYAGLNYAINRYGNPGWLGVLGHGHGYAYGGQVMDSGGWLPPGRSLVWNGTGNYEHLSRDSGSAVTGGWHATLDDVCTKLDALIGVTGQQGRSFAGALNGTAAAAGTRGSYSTRR